MAIAAIYLLYTPQSRQSLGDYLSNCPEVYGIELVGADKIAATLEMPAKDLTSYLQKLANLPDVLNLEVVYINYEDDIDQQGFMTAPPEAGKNG